MKNIDFKFPTPTRTVTDAETARHAIGSEGGVRLREAQISRPRDVEAERHLAVNAFALLAAEQPLRATVVVTMMIAAAAGHLAPGSNNLR